MVASRSIRADAAANCLPPAAIRRRPSESRSAALESFFRLTNIRLQQGRDFVRFVDVLEQPRLQSFQFGRQTGVARRVGQAGGRVGAADRGGGAAHRLQRRADSSGRLCRPSSPATGPAPLSTVRPLLAPVPAARGSVTFASCVSDFLQLARAVEPDEAEVGATEGFERRTSAAVRRAPPSAGLRRGARHRLTNRSRPPIARWLPAAARLSPSAISCAPSTSRSEPWTSSPAPSLASAMPPRSCPIPPAIVRRPRPSRASCLTGPMLPSEARIALPVSCSGATRFAISPRAGDQLDARQLARRGAGSDRARRGSWRR